MNAEEASCIKPQAELYNRSESPYLAPPMSLGKHTALIVFAASAWAPTSRALTLEIQQKKQDVLRFTLPDPAPNSIVGDVTVEEFRQLEIPFAGDASGILSIYGMGSDLEVLNDRVLKAWGWCFAIDGQVGDKMPDQVQVPLGAKTLKWFYAYALYDSGTWTGYCIQDKYAILANKRPHS